MCYDVLGEFFSSKSVPGSRENNSGERLKRVPGVFGFSYQSIKLITSWCLEGSQRILFFFKLGGHCHPPILTVVPVATVETKQRILRPEKRNKLEKPLHQNLGP